MVFNMKPIVFPEYILNNVPSSYHGRWRMVAQVFSRNSKGELDGKRECVRTYATVFDD
jgi:hypothetical protein